MGEPNPNLEEACNDLEAIDGIRVNRASLPRKGLIVVEEESAVGEFFRYFRENDNVERTSTTRGDLAGTVLDSWIWPDE